MLFFGVVLCDGNLLTRLSHECASDAATRNVLELLISDAFTEALQIRLSKVSGTEGEGNFTASGKHLVHSRDGILCLTRLIQRYFTSPRCVLLECKYKQSVLSQPPSAEVCLWWDSVWRSASIKHGHGPSARSSLFFTAHHQSHIHTSTREVSEQSMNLSMGWTHLHP